MHLLCAGRARLSSGGAALHSAGAAAAFSAWAIAFCLPNPTAPPAAERAGRPLELERLPLPALVLRRGGAALHPVPHPVRLWLRCEMGHWLPGLLGNGCLKPVQRKCAVQGRSRCQQVPHTRLLDGLEPFEPCRRCCRLLCLAAGFVVFVLAFAAVGLLPKVGHAVQTSSPSTHGADIVQLWCAVHQCAGGRYYPGHCLPGGLQQAANHRVPGRRPQGDRRVRLERSLVQSLCQVFVFTWTGAVWVGRGWLGVFRRLVAGGKSCCVEA